MMKKKLGAMLMTLVMLSSMSLAGCKKAKKETSAETEGTPTVPSIMEEIGADQLTYEPRGEVQLDVEDGETSDANLLRPFAHADQHDVGDTDE
ncbi:MAG: hypothetical protein IKH92_08140, partial [Clostridiales bacterium]|nr:hypothetical protein [Clostridiales bacterium]